ncbi:TAP42-like family [Seminavis robusta]|uniref:TAP42-like family n=1 Tax=Seminavis robusta TaxID=568900 RepID=A0A9N8H2I1_9STRA|nr:TAP42-like family [Seminavis robusta]|eukprot:Sro65_g036940.1 TAP42-like family (383) ;mRNA; r:120266-121661
MLFVSRHSFQFPVISRDHEVKSLDSQPLDAARDLERLQQEVAQLSLFSSNEGLEDVSTKSLPLLALEHHLALAYTRLPSGRGQMNERQSQLRRSVDLWAAFLHKLETLESNSSSSNDDFQLVTPAEQKEYQMLLECSSSTTTTEDDNNNSQQPPQLPAANRDDKIARFKAKQQAQKEVERLKSLRERRSRIGVAAEEVMDEFDEETLDRSVAMTNLLLAKAEALEEWASTLRELPMIARMVQMEQDRMEGRMQPPPQRATASGLQVTHITLDGANNNQLQFKREEIKSQVFRPGWNQPTMSLHELADRERADAIARGERQKAAEANQQLQPRRYDQLQRDGLEDNANAVDASAALDQAWDDWKDENPRGSGNKRGDQGDRNF